MKLRLLHPGRAPTGPLGAAAEGYQRRIYGLKVETQFVRPHKAPDKRPKEALAEEAKRLQSAFTPQSVCVALCVEGDLWSSEALAKHLETWMNRGTKAVTFILGGAHGLDPAIKKKANHRWSLGRITLPHDLAQVVLWEQLYRAQTILRGEPYHK